MADPYNGDAFIAIDDEILEDYGAKDTHLDHLVRNQGAWLNTHGNRIGHGWLNPNQNHDAFTGDRAYALFRRLCVYMGDFYVAPGLKKLDVSFELRTSTSDPAPPAGESLGRVEVTVELVGYGEITEIIESDADYRQIDMELELLREPVSTIPTLLRIWIKSFTKSRQGLDASTFQAVEVATLRPLGNAFFPEPPATAPHQNSLAEQAMVIGGRFYELLDQSPGGGGQFATADVWPTPPTMRTTDETNDLAPDLVYLTYAQIRGFHVTETFDPKLMSQASIAALIPERSRTSAKHVINSARAARRPRCHTLGYRGEYDPDPEGSMQTWPYWERWRHIAHDGEHNRIGGIGLTIDQWILQVNEPSPLLDVMFWVCPWYATRTDEGEGLSAFAETTYEKLIEDHIQLPWTFRAEVFQYGAGASVASEDLEVNLQHVPASVGGTWPLLQQLHRRHARDSRRGYTLKEGALYDEDFGLLIPIRMVIDGSAITELIRDRPLGFRLSVLPEAIAPEDFPGGFQNQATTSTTYFTVVGGPVVYERATF